MFTPEEEAQLRAQWQQESELDAVGKLDGRYHRDTKELAPYQSEGALIAYRTGIEGAYLVALSDAQIIRPLDPDERETLLGLRENMTMDQKRRVKAIEGKTRHDVKAVEYGLAGMLEGTTMADLRPAIHFALTSEDINNLAYRLMLRDAVHEVLLPSADTMMGIVVEQADRYKAVPMLARTHGQPAVPTTVGKELVNYATRMQTEIQKLGRIVLTGKLNGAVGNYNDHALALPDTDWIDFSQKFVASLGLEPNLYTTQINPCEDMIEMLQGVMRLNGVVLDLDQDMWHYIGDDWLVQEVGEDEVGSSVMAQKVNPIDYESSEGNIKVINHTIFGICQALGTSRLQRDLSGSTVSRDISTSLAQSLLAYKGTIKGLKKITPNLDQIAQDLNFNWTILSAGVQTLLRNAGVANAYEVVAKLVKRRHITGDNWGNWVQELETALGETSVDPLVFDQIRQMSPDNYIGYAVQLTERAIAEIQASRN